MHPFFRDETSIIWWVYVDDECLFKRSSSFFSTNFHSLSMMENHAVSRFFPLMIMCWRNVPSYVNPSPRAAAFDFSFSASDHRESKSSQWHLTALPFESSILESIEAMAECKQASFCIRIGSLPFFAIPSDENDWKWDYQMFPISMERFAGTMFRYVMIPILFDVALSTTTNGTSATLLLSLVR